MISRFITGPIMGALAAILAIAFAVQTVRIDGFPIFYDGLRSQLLACENAQAKANEAAQAAAEKAREDGRVAAIADRERIEASDKQRAADSAKTVADLQAIVARLKQPQPPMRVTVDQPLPLVVTPPVGMSCDLDRSALDDLRERLNRGRL